MRPVAIGLLMLVLRGSAALAADPPAIRLEPHLVRAYDGTERPAELGRLAVPARRARPLGARVELAVLRFRSTAAAPGDPIVFLMGGPGIPASVMAQVPVYAQLFERLRGVADVILLDQRGTGLSRPSLDCPPREAPFGLDAFESQATLVRELRTEIQACVAIFRAQGVDPAAYTTAENADDVADLTAAFGAKRISLLAYSYGTEAALAVMRRHGSAVGRVVLAGVRGPDQLLKLPGVFDLKLRQVARLAAASSALAGTLRDADDLVSRLRRVLQAAETPLRLSVLDRSTQKPVELRVGREGLQTLVVQYIDSPRLPALIVTLDQGDTRVLARLLEPLYASFSRGGSSLMARAVNCSTGASPPRLARAAAEAEWSLLGRPFENVMVSPAYCDAVGAAEPDALSWRPFTSDAPTLFISGALDSQTPPAQAEDVRYGFANGVHLVVSHAGHETLPIGAVQEAIVDFLAGKDVAGRSIAADPPAYWGVEDAANRPCGPRGC